MKRIYIIIIVALLSLVTADAKKQKQLVVLHTNDTHSTILPLNENLDNKDLATVATSRRAQAIIPSSRAR